MDLRQLEILQALAGSVGSDAMASAISQVEVRKLGFEGDNIAKLSLRTTLAGGVAASV